MEMGSGRGFGSREGGPGMGSGDIVPEYKRWKIDYDSNSIQEYAQQLSFFSIDIGVIDENSNAIIRIRDPGGTAAVTNSNRGSEKSSLYFSHEKQRFRRWDDTLTRQNNVPLNGRFTVQFYPNPTRAMLREIEKNYLAQQGKTLEDVRRTFFKVVPAAGGFEFQLTGMDYRL